METSTFMPPPQPPDTGNGHPNSAGDTGHFHYYSQRDNDRETTRYLSAATQIDLGYARSVVARVVHEPYRALAPAHGADVTVVARWALDSLRRILYRDAALTATLLTGVFSCWILATIARASAWAVFAAALVMFAVAFSMIAAEFWVRWYRILAGQMLRDEFDPAAAPNPATERSRVMLQAAAGRMNGNLVVFAGKGAFVGSGSLLGQEQLVIDASRGKKKEDDSPGEPVPFSNTDVHRAITKAIENIRLPGLHVAERVFVNGKHVRGNRALQRRPLEPPFASVSEQLVRDAAENPTADARVYVCAEIHGWQGQLVVTMFARAVHTGGWLYIEYSFYLLPPIDAGYTQVDALYNQPLARRVGRTTSWSLVRTLPYLLMAPFSLAKYEVEMFRWNARESAQGFVIQRGRSFDYGALRSIREEACTHGSRHYFITRDIVMYVLLMQKSLLREMENFLDDHNIATADFKEQAKIIIDASYKNYSLHIGKVSNSNFAVGDKSSAGGAEKDSDD